MKMGVLNRGHECMKVDTPPNETLTEHLINIRFIFPSQTEKQRLINYTAHRYLTVIVPSVISY